MLLEEAPVSGRETQRSRSDLRDAETGIFVEALEVLPDGNTLSNLVLRTRDREGEEADNVREDTFALRLCRRVGLRNAGLSGFMEWVGAGR